MAFALVWVFAKAGRDRGGSNRETIPVEHLFNNDVRADLGGPLAVQSGLKMPGSGSATEWHGWCKDTVYSRIVG